MTEFVFRKENHTYWLDGLQIPSLSSIICPMDDFSSVHPAVLSAKAEHGTNVHETIRLYLDCTLDTDSLGEGNKIAVDLFEEYFCNEGRRFGKLLNWETPTYHDRLKYGTTPDLVYEEAVVEIKTRPMKLCRDAVQLVAQAACFPDFPPKSKWVLFIDIENNAYKFTKCEHRQAWAMFRLMLKRYTTEKEFSETLKKWKEYG